MKFRLDFSRKLAANQTVGGITVSVNSALLAAAKIRLSSNTEQASFDAVVSNVQVSGDRIQPCLLDIS